MSDTVIVASAIEQPTLLTFDRFDLAAHARHLLLDREQIGDRAALRCELLQPVHRELEVVSASS